MVFNLVMPFQVGYLFGVLQSPVTKSTRRKSTKSVPLTLGGTPMAEGCTFSRQGEASFSAQKSGYWSHNTCDWSGGRHQQKCICSSNG
eukprot:s3008_g9.t1